MSRRHPALLFAVPAPSPARALPPGRACHGVIFHIVPRRGAATNQPQTHNLRLFPAPAQASLSTSTSTSPSAASALGNSWRAAACDICFLQHMRHKRHTRAILFTPFFFQAPELVRLPRSTAEHKEALRQAKQAQYTAAVDIWALGCGAGAALCTQPPPPRAARRRRSCHSPGAHSAPGVSAPLLTVAQECGALTAAPLYPSLCL